MEKALKRLSAFLAAILVFIAVFTLIFSTDDAYAAEGQELTPTEGWELNDTCEWRIDQNTYTLTIRPANGLEEGRCSFRYCSWSGYVEAVRTLKIEGSIKPDSIGFREAFKNYSNLTNIEGLENLDTSDVTVMSEMFSGCSSLTSLDLSSFDTSHVGSMDAMFSGCSSLTSLDLSSFDTSHVYSMDAMFSGCSSLTSLDLSSFDTSHISDMSEMFSGCSFLEDINLSSFNTWLVNYMTDMFYGCSSLVSLDVANFNTSLVTNFSRMFYGCSSLASLDVSNFNTSRAGSMQSMFYGCSSLVSLDVSRFDTSKVRTIDRMFSDCTFLERIDLSSFDTSNVSDYTPRMFYGCSSLKEITIGSKFTIISSAFPSTKWYNSKGEGFNSPSEIPVGVADTYTPAIMITSIKIQQPSTTLLDVGGSLQLSATVEPSDTTESIVWKSSNENVAIVDQNGYVTSKAEGYVTISATDGGDTWNAIKDSISLSVNKRVQSIVLSETAKVVNVGDSPFTLVATVTPADSFNGAIAWSSTNTDVATVDADGRVTPVGVGSTVIVASAGTMTAQCTLTVISSNVDIVPVESVTIDRTIAEIVGKQTLQLSATSAPENATYKAIVWSSSNESVATVNNKGVVEAKGKGEATITASSLDGKKSATCKVTVLNPPVSLSFGDMNSTLKIGETISVSFAGAGDLPGATEELTSPTWINSDAGFAELSADGFSASLTGLSVGKVTISVDAIYDGQHISASKEIEVVWNDPESITLNESKIHSLVGDDSFSLVSTVMPESASGYQVLWSSSDPDVVSVEQNGRVDIHKSGYAVITARAGAVFATCEVNINAKSIPAATDSDLKGYVLIDDPDLAKELDGLRLRISNNDRKSASEVKSAAVDSLSNGTTLADLYDIDLIDGNDDVHPWDSDSKSVSVYIVLTDELKKLSSSNDLIVHYLSDDLSKRETKKTWIEGENLIFDTTHFSTYAVTASPIENKSPVVNNTNVSGDPKGSLPKTGDSSTVFILIVTSAILALASTLILATYRRRSLNQK